MFDNKANEISESRIFSDGRNFFCRVSDGKLKGPFKTKAEAKNCLTSSFHFTASNEGQFSWSDLRVMPRKSNSIY